MSKKDSTMIKIESLVKSYNDKRPPIINNLYMEVKKSEIVILFGKSGCGKTTLLNLIAGLDRPTSGKVFVNGTRIDRMSEDRLARFRLLNVGFVFQDYNLIADLPILENVSLPLKLAGKKDLERAQELLEIFDIEKLADEKANTVSGGEAQRASIARAVANNPKILLADEPTGNLDNENQANVMNYFKKVQSEFGTTLILATHNRELEDFGNRSIEMGT